MLKLSNKIGCSLLLLFSSLMSSNYRTGSHWSVDFPAYRWPKEHQTGWVSASVFRAKTKVGYDLAGDEGPLFAGYGPARFGMLTRNYPYLSRFDKTKDFIENTVLDPQFEGKNKDLFCDGEVEIIDFNGLVSVPLGDSFLAFFELPVRLTKMSALKFVTLNGVENDFAKVVNAGIDDVLVEHGIEKISKSTSLDGMSDLTASIGWSDKHVNNDPKVAVSAIGASARVGVIIPTSTISGFNRNFLYNVPVGNNGSFGVRMQADMEIEFRPYVSAVGMIDSKILLRKKETLRLKLTSEQQGLFFGPFGEVTYDNGHAWRLGAALKMGSPEMGVFTAVGYTYSSKEISRLELSDDEKAKKREFEVFKATNQKDKIFRDGDVTQATLATAPKETVQFSDFVINTDSQLARQYVHAVHLSLQVKPKLPDMGEDGVLTGPAPIIELAYHYPVFGKNYIAASFLGGSGSFGVKLQF